MFYSLFTIFLCKVVNFNSCHANPSTLQSRMVSINLIIHQQWLIVRYSHSVRSLQSSGSGGNSILGGGGPGPDIKFRGKNWGKVLPSSPKKRKNMGNSVTTTRKTWERIIVLGAFGVIPETQRAKFGVFVIQIFGSKFWGQAPPPTSWYGSIPWGSGAAVAQLKQTLLCRRMVN